MPGGTFQIAVLAIITCSSIGCDGGAGDPDAGRDASLPAPMDASVSADSGPVSPLDASSPDAAGLTDAAGLADAGGPTCGDLDASGTWIDLGRGFGSEGSILRSYDPAIGVLQDGTPIVALGRLTDRSMVAAESFVSVLQWTGSAWEPLGSMPETSGGFRPGSIHLEVDGSNRPVVVWDRGSELTGRAIVQVSRFESGTWRALEGPRSGPADLAQMSYDIATSSGSDDIVACWSEDSLGLFFGRWTGSAWQVLGGAVADGWCHVALGTDGTAYRVWRQLESPDLHVARWSGTAWTDLGGPITRGPPTGRGASGSSLAVGPDGRLHLTYAYDDGAGNQVFVQRWSGSSWEDLGSPSLDLSLPPTAGSARAPELVFDGVDRPIVVFATTYDGFYVGRGSGGTWELIGHLGTGTDDFRVSAPTIAATPCGDPVVAWEMPFRMEDMIFAHAFTR